MEASKDNNTVKTNVPTSKPLINTAAIEQQLFKRQQIAEDLKVCYIIDFIMKV